MTDYRPNWAPLSPTTVTNNIQVLEAPHKVFMFLQEENLKLQKQTINCNLNTR